MRNPIMIARAIRAVSGVLGLTGIFSAVNAEKINLNIYANTFDSIPIGVVDFTVTSGGSLGEESPEKVIANDFYLSGRFHVVNRPVFDSAAFAAQSVGMYIGGEYSVKGDEVAVTCMVKEVAGTDQLFTKEYAGKVPEARRIAHRFSNDLYEVLFGDRGIFESRVLFVKCEERQKNIAIMDFDGHDVRQITKGAVLNLFPAFVSPTTMVWTSYLRGKPDIYTGSIADGKPAVIAASRGIQVSPAVSPIDGTIVYASSKGGNLDIYTCNPDGSDTRQLTVNGGVETAPCWSPNGYQIAFTSDRSGNPQIFIMDADGANQRRITYKSRYSDSPAWSPKGDRIAFTSMKENGKLDIWVVSLDGSGEEQITWGAGHNEYPAWSSDGSLIGFVNRSGAKSNFYIMKPDGSRAKQVTFSNDVSMPDWGK